MKSREEAMYHKLINISSWSVHIEHESLITAVDKKRLKAILILHNPTAKGKNYTEFTNSSTFPYQFYTTRYYRFSVTDFEQSKFT